MADPLDELTEAARAALPPVEGEVAVTGLREPVEVLRDRWGIPYLSAASQDDLWFAQGFVQASERLFQIELALRAANGRLSEWFSDLTVPADRFARTVGFHRIGALEADRWTDPSRAMMRRFVEGSRAWVASMPAPPLEYAMLGMPPELPEDLEGWAAAFAYLAWGLSGNWDDELLRLRLSERLGASAAEALLPPAPVDAGPAAGSLAGRLLEGLPRSRGQGSNNWVVSGSRTASGRPLLANDPHLLAQQPAAWFELHLRAPGYEARGVAFPFAPGIVVGTTSHHAWGVTNVSGDIQDLYVERLNDTGTAAEFDGTWETLEVRSETIEVRGGRALTFDVRETRHGPILETATVGVAGTEFVPIDGTFALRWAAADGLLEPSSLVDLVRATSFEEFREALRGLSCPGQNVVYADIEGTIGYQCTGRFPIRRTGEGSAPVPGWTSEHEWDGYLPFDELPWSKDPGTSFIVTANNRMHDEDYPHLIGLDFHPPFRARRIAHLLSSNDAVTVADCGSIQVDTVSLPAQRLLPHLVSIDSTNDEARRHSTGCGDGTVTCAPTRGRRRCTRSGWARSPRTRSAPKTIRRRSPPTSRPGRRSCARRCRRCSRAEGLHRSADLGTRSSPEGWPRPSASSRNGSVTNAPPGAGARSIGSGSPIRSLGCRGSGRYSSRASTNSAVTSRQSCKRASTPTSASTPW